MNVSRNQDRLGWTLRAMARKKAISRNEMLELAADLAAEYGESLTLTAFRRETGLSQWAIFDLFGNWKNLRLAVGLTPEAPRLKNRISEGRIVEMMREQVARQGKNLTELQFLKATGLSGRLIADRFGSWGELRELVGLAPRAKIEEQYTDWELIEDLYRFYRRYREKPKFHQHKHRGGRISAQTIRDRYGTWATACKALKGYLRQRGVRNDWEPLPSKEDDERWGIVD